MAEQETGYDEDIFRVEQEMRKKSYVGYYKGGENGRTNCDK